MAQHARKEEYVIHAVIENTQITSKETDIYSVFSCIKRHSLDSLKKIYRNSVFIYEVMALD